MHFFLYPHRWKRGVPAASVVRRFASDRVDELRRTLLVALAMMGMASVVSARPANLRISPPLDPATPPPVKAAAGSTPDITAGQEVGSSIGTSDKPQSKIWYNDGFYWAILQKSSGSYFFQLVDGLWVQGDFVDSHTNHGEDGREDVLWNGTELFVLVHSGRPELYKYTYDASAETYDLLPGFPVDLDIADGSETIVLDQDSTGRLWAAYEGEGRVYVAYSTSPDHLQWETPGVVLRDGLDSDDIATVARYASTRIGVFWSDQNRWEFGFRYHADGDPPDLWSGVEIVYPGSGNSDDHINLASDREGRLFAITKDARDEFAVHRRDPDGSWTTREDISNGQKGTRPVLVVDPDANDLFALYTCWSCSGPNSIVYRVGSTSSLSFGSSQSFISKSMQSVNDVTDMKQILPTASLLAIAEGGGTAYWNDWGSPPAGNGFEGLADWTIPPPMPLPDAPENVAFFETGFDPSPEIVGLFLFDEEDGERVLNGADVTGHGTLGRSGSDGAEPQRISGFEDGALRFDGSNDYVLVPDRTDLRFDSSFTLEAWIRRLAPGSPDVILAKGGSGRDYRMEVNETDHLELVWETTSGAIRSTPSSSTLTDTEWHHVACVHDESLGEDRIYIDGFLDAVRQDGSSPEPGTGDLILGARRKSGTLQDFWNGELDLVRLSSDVMYTQDFTPPTTFQGPDWTAYALLDWPEITGGAPIVGYNVYRRSNAGPEQLLTAIPNPTKSFADFGAVDGILEYALCAVNSEGLEGPRSDPLVVTFGNGPTPPGSPEPLLVFAVQSWEPPVGIARYAFDEGQGTRTTDDTGNGFDAELGALGGGDPAEPTWVAGLTGTALHFDGTDDYCEVADDPALRFEGSFTLEAWVHRQETGEEAVIVSKEATSTRNYRLSILSSGKLQLYWKDTSGVRQKTVGSVAVPTGSWHHVAGVRDATANENRLFLDGQPVGSEPTTGIPQTGSQPLRFGARKSDSWKEFFQGDLDLVRVTPTALYEGAFIPPRDFAGQRLMMHELQWSASQGGSASLLGYTVERRFEDGDWESMIGQPIPQLAMQVEATSGVPVGYRVTAVDLLGLETSVTSFMYVDPGTTRNRIAKISPAIGLDLGATPNPFNPTTQISFRLAEPTVVRVRVYDVAGRHVRTLADALLPEGRHDLDWNGRDHRQTPLASGVYFLRLEAGRATRQLKLVLTK